MFRLMDLIISARITENMSGAQKLPNGFRNKGDRHLVLYCTALQFESELPKTNNIIHAHFVEAIQAFAKPGAWNEKFYSRNDVGMERSPLCKAALMDVLESGSPSFHRKLLEALIEKCVDTTPW